VSIYFTLIVEFCTSSWLITKINMLL